MSKNTSTAPRRALWAGAVFCLVSLVAAPATAQMVCGNHADIEKRLETGYQEYRTAVGLAHNNAMIEIYTSEKGTFTIVLTRPNGMSCLMAVGEGWESVGSPKPAGSASVPPLTSRG